MMKCLEIGYEVSKPLLNSSKYDFILDIGSEMLKIQVKTSRQDKQGGFYIDCRNRHHSTKYEDGEIDYFMTEANDNYYLFSAKDCGVKKTVKEECLFENVLRCPSGLRKQS